MSMKSKTFTKLKHLQIAYKNATFFRNTTTIQKTLIKRTSRKFHFVTS